jgi:hypothetical protein
MSNICRNQLQLGQEADENNIHEPCPGVLLLIIFEMPTMVQQTTTKRVQLGHVWRCAISNMFYIYFESVANRRVHRHACTALHCMARHGIARHGTAFARHCTACAPHLHGIAPHLHGFCTAFCTAYYTAFARHLHGLFARL